MADAYSESSEAMAFQEMAHAMAIQVHQEFPLVDGTVINKENEIIYTDLGKDEIKKQRRILIYKEISIEDPKRGTIIGTDHEIIGHARVVEVDGSFSKAIVFDGNKDEITPENKVISE